MRFLTADQLRAIHKAPRLCTKARTTEVIRDAYGRVIPENALVLLTYQTMGVYKIAWNDRVADEVPEKLLLFGVK
jgi:hypothetical protein